MNYLKHLSLFTLLSLPLPLCSMEQKTRNHKKLTDDEAVIFTLRFTKEEIEQFKKLYKAQSSLNTTNTIIRTSPEDYAYIQALLNNIDKPQVQLYSQAVAFNPRFKKEEIERFKKIYPEDYARIEALINLLDNPQVQL